MNLIVNNVKKIFRNTTLLLVASSFMLTGSCKKYPDGPLVSIETKEKRIVGVWDVEYFEINGYDSNSYLKNKPFYGMYTLSEKEKGEVAQAGYEASDDKYDEGGWWELRNKKSYIFISLGNTLYPESKLGPYRASDVLWEIRRLTDKQLWLKTTYLDGRTYLLKFKLFKDR
jgi:hypothetical protein